MVLSLCLVSWFVYWACVFIDWYVYSFWFVYSSSCIHILLFLCFQVDTNHHTMAKYLMELTLIDYDMAHYHPSEIAAAALCLSMKLYDGEEANWVSS